MLFGSSDEAVNSRVREGLGLLGVAGSTARKLRWSTRLECHGLYLVES